MTKTYQLHNNFPFHCFTPLYHLSSSSASRLSSSSLLLMSKLSFLCLVWSGPALPVCPSLRAFSTDSWIQQTDASGNRPDRCLLREPPPCTLNNFPQTRSSCPPAHEPIYHPFHRHLIRFLTPALLFFHSESRHHPSLSSKLKLLSSHLYQWCRLCLSPFISLL